MERLTIKNSDGSYSQPTDTKFHEIFNKLGELEDILESWHIENLEELKTRLHDCQVYHLKNNSNETLIHNLKNELAELKQKAIVPKFQANQETWYYHIGNNKIYSGIIEDMQWRPVNGMYYRIPNLQRDYYWIREDELFATREEAEQRLAEIGDKDE